MADQGNVSFFRELTETKERAAAWVFRVAIFVATGLFAIIGYLLTASLNDFKTSIERRDRATSEAISELTHSTVALTNTVTALSATVAERAKQDDKAEVEIGRRLQDHETRLRTLERPANH